MVKLITLIAALTMALPPVQAEYACMERGAAFYNYTGGAYSEIARLPETYFVAVIKENDDGYSLVSYMDLSGYVKTEDVKKVDFTPKYKYADVTFCVQNDGQPANLRMAPDSTDKSNILLVMPDGASGKVIGTAEGSELIAGAGKRWYYVRYENGSDYTYGYVYGAHISPVTFPTNSYERETENAAPGTEQEEGRPSLAMSLPVQIIIIALLCLPVIVITLMLYSSSKKSRSPRHIDGGGSDSENNGPS